MRSVYLDDTDAATQEVFDRTKESGADAIVKVMKINIAIIYKLYYIFRAENLISR
jgi:hypothetical protein